MRRNRRFCILCFVCGCILTGCGHKPVNTVTVHPQDFCDSAQIECYEYLFSDELMDTTLTVTLTYPENSQHRLVPWANGKRVRVGYSYTEKDTVYFAFACSQDILKEEGDVYTFRRKFKPYLKVAIARSKENISEAVTKIYKSVVFF